MKAIPAAVLHWCGEIMEAWNGFWFKPVLPHTLALIRILGGLMLLYTHCVWALDLMSFVGPHAWVNDTASRMIAGSEYAWSYLWLLKTPAELWVAHGIALAIFTALVVGYKTRVVSVLAWLITLAYCHRLQGALFGLDQVNAMLAMYLTLGPSGAVWSVDRWLAARKRRAPSIPALSVGANVATRLIQVHLCIVYLFGGISKLKGTMWWDGSAVWYSLANYEYQSIDLTWLGTWPSLLAFLTHATVFWETFYPVLVWPRLTRPVMLCLAVCVHGSIAIGLSMPTFGLAMIIANLAFLEPTWVARLADGIRNRSRR